MTVQTTTTQQTTNSDLRSAAFRVKRLEPSLAGEIDHLDLHQPLDALTVKALRAALLERKVLVFRQQSLSPDELQRFATYFGEPFGSPDYAYGH